MKKYGVEFLGTFILVFCGCGAAVVDEITRGAVTHVGVAVCFGLVVMALIYAFGDISGCHINPAVTLAFTVQKSFPLREVMPYLMSQFAGALFAAETLHLLFPQSNNLASTLPAFGAMQSFVMEIILTFILQLVILQVATGSKEKGLFAGAAIGSVVLLEAMFAGPISGASMNPARSLGPALVSQHLEHTWIYLTAPVLGALLAVFVYQIINKA